MGKYGEKIYIEFNGFPGGGKTTVSSKLIETLSESAQVGTRFEMLKQVKYRIKHFKLSIKDYYRCLLTLILIIVISLCVKPLNKNRFIWIKRAYYFCLGYILTVDEKKLKKVYIVDEGIIQTLSGIAYTDQIKHKKLVQNCYLILRKMIGELVIINCNVDPRISIERIRFRNREGRFDSIESNQRLAEGIATFGEHLQLFRNIEKTKIQNNLIINLNMEEDINSNVNKIIDGIKRYSKS